MAIQIDTGVPIPRRAGPRAKSESLLAILSLEVGQSFFVPENAANMSGKTGYAKALTGRIFTLRPREENGISGTRVWRIE